MHTNFPGSVAVDGVLSNMGSPVVTTEELKFDNLSYTDTGHGNIKGPDSSHNLATTTWVSNNFQKRGSDRRLKKILQICRI